MPDLRGKDYSVEVRRSNGHFVASSPEWEAADRPHRGFGETAGAATRDLWAKLDEALCWLAPEVMPKPKGAKHVQP